jgi:transposase-like protein
MTFLEFSERFPTKEKVLEYFISVRYPDGISCNHCGSKKVYPRQESIKIFHCNECSNSFSLLKGSIFEKSSTDLRKWVYAIHLFLNGKKGISGLQLQREIGVTYKTAWRMLNKIREAMGNKDMEDSFNAIVEIDETYVGGKPRKENNTDNDSPGTTAVKYNKKGRGTNKTPVIGVKDRSSKNVFAKVALPNKKGQKLTGKQLLNILDAVCKEDTTVMTDDFKGYNILNKTTSKNYFRLFVNHSARQFSTGNGIHTNGIESFWAILKRGIYGIYHHVSVKYLQNYVNEFCFRQNNRGNGDIFECLVKQCVTN